MQAMELSELPTTEIAARTGVAQSTLFRFIKNERSLTLASIEKLAEYFELELRKD